MNKNFFRRRKYCPFSSPSSPDINYKDIKLLQRYISERGKIIPSRITAVSSSKQRELSIAIKRARVLALLPYALKQVFVMKIVLLERINKLGQMGDIVDVRSGYARNFLLPFKKALRATKENINFCQF